MDKLDHCIAAISSDCSRIHSKTEIVQESAIGCGLILAGKCLSHYILHLLPRITTTQDVVQIFYGIATIHNTLLRIALKTTYAISITVIIPWLEEIIFREVFFHLIKISDYPTVEKIIRVVTNGLLFGLMHINPMMGAANIPIIFATTLLGIIFATLREWRGNRIACTSAHITHNILSLLTLKI